jgi:hypothetical protein
LKLEDTKPLVWKMLLNLDAICDLLLNQIVLHDCFQHNRIVLFFP